MKLVLFAVLLVLVFSLGCRAGTSNVLLSDKGKALAAIIVPPDAIPPEKTAAAELANYLKQVTGADFPIVASAAAARQRTRIFIGQTATTKLLMPGFDFGTLGRDGIVIRRTGNDLVLAGDRPRGTIYAVYTFLEDMVGCRWWTAQASYIPHKPTLAVPVKDATYAPPFLSRETFYNQIINANPEFAVRLKLNGHFQSIPPELGGHYTILGFVHTFSQLIPVDKYYADHPEWFSLLKGERTKAYAQLCLTNNEMREELTKNALAWIKADPEAGMISIAQNDAGGACQCPNCRAIVKQTGSESGLVVWFVNQVAADIEKQYPDFLVETLAYQFTRKAPTNIKPRHNVLIRLCSIECDFAKPLTAPTNATFYRDLMAWKAISQHMYVWDYTVGFGNLMMPNPNFRVLAPNIRLFARSNVIGMFEQGDGYNPDADFAAMKTWLFGHLLWNPRANENKLMNEFLNGYYGPAGEYMRAYIDLLCDTAAASNKLLPWDNTDFEYLTAPVLIKAATLFDAAEKSVAGDAELLRRVKLQKAGLQLATVLNAPGNGLPAGKDLERVLDDFFAVSDQSSNVFRQEGTQMSPDYRQQLKEKAAGQRLYIVANATRADSMPGYSDAETFAEMRKTMTEVFDFPKNGWRFSYDKSNVGLKEGWYRTAFDDSPWLPFGIGKFWEEQLGGDYNGFAWYRIRFTPPAVEPGKQIFLVIGAADDYADVWLNNRPVGGQHLEIGVGWKTPFAMDVTQVIKPGQQNVLAVRVEDAGALGGLWKSIKLMTK
jgi:hypothetical protein